VRARKGKSNKGWFKVVDRIRMEDALDASDVRLFSRGDTVTGTVVEETEGEFLVDIGYKSEALLPKGELAPFHEVVGPGEELEVIVTYIDEENSPKGTRSWRGRIGRARPSRARSSRR